MLFDEPLEFERLKTTLKERLLRFERFRQRVVELFGSKATAVMTNVPGPRESLYLAGKRLRHIMFWVPQSGRLGLGISILSYAGEVCVGVATDAGLVPAPEAIVAGFEAEFDELMDLVRLVEADGKAERTRASCASSI
jgi:hypothetical protein